MKSTALTLALATTLVVGLVAESPEFSFEGPRIFGADVGVSVGPWKLVAGAGWEDLAFGRDQETGLPLRPSGSQPDPVVSHPFPNVSGSLAYSGDLTWAVGWVAVGAWGHGDFGLGTPAPRFPDLHGNTFGFVRVGLTRDGRTKGPRGVVEGPWAEAFVEWGPGLASVRDTDYTKVSLATAWALPLWHLEAPSPLFAGTLALRANARWIGGAQVPVPLLEATEVRGYHELLDSRFRSVVSAELRVSLPSLWNDHDAVPVVLVFTEGGWYAGYDDAPASVRDQSGWLASAGAGVGMGFFGAFTPTVQVALPLTGESDLWTRIFFSHRF